ncbi:hypothetical protein PLICRDRAFT_124555 [Plicaturopsis crispa FD-325 SS-3]|nr:hypothetical protein PLICRDRAFT_124555 [Plicaturopsis crispa FD-325 SS-3]
MSVVPSSEDVLSAIRWASSTVPVPEGPPSMLKKIKAEHPDWCLSLARLKKATAQLKEVPPEDERIPLTIKYAELMRQNPALREQIVYQETSIRYYRILGKDGFDYGVTFNSDMALFFNIMETRALTEPARRPHALYHMFEQLLPAAVKAKVSKEDLRQQLWKEFGCDPLLIAPPEPRTPEEFAQAARREEAARESHKKNSIMLKRELIKHSPEARALIPVDSDGEPIFREEIDGRFAVIVAKLRKGSGLEELGTL